MVEGAEAGSPQERAILAYVIEKPSRRLALDTLSSEDFSIPWMGQIWDGIARDVQAGIDVSNLTLDTRYEAWGIPAHAVSPGAHWAWTDLAYQVGAPDPVVDSIRADATRRFAKILLKDAASQVDSDPDPEAALLEIDRSIRERVSGAKTRDRFQSYTARELMAMEFSEEFVIDDLLERQDRCILTGVEGHGKSTLARQLVIYAGAGLHPFTSHMGIPVPLRDGPVKSLVIDAENTAKQWQRNLTWIVKRVQRFGERWDPRDNVTVVPTGRIDILKPADMGEIYRKMDEIKPDIVFVGPLYRVTRGGMNGEEEAMQAIAALDTIRDRDVALLMEAHSGHTKDGNQRSTRPRGSSALLGWPEFGMGIRPQIDPITSIPEPGAFELNAWRGAREGGRVWPKMLRRGQWSDPFPWMPDDEEMVDMGDEPGDYSGT